MKRTDLIRHLESHGCVFVREGGKHTVYKNPDNGDYSTVPRHNVLKKHLAHKMQRPWRTAALIRIAFQQKLYRAVQSI